jgi:hypothetical protein
MIAGPGLSGTATASADLFGIGGILDILDHRDHKKKKSDHGAKVSGQQNGGSNRTDRPGEPDRTSSSSPPSTSDDDESSSADRPGESVDVPESATTGARIAPPAAVSGGGFSRGSGGVPISGGIGRAPNLAPVPTAPSNRSVVIRAAPPAAAPTAPAAPAAPVVAPVAPVVVPPVVVPPVPVVVPAPAAPSGGGAPAAPAAPGAPAVTVPSVEVPVPQAPPPNAVPEAFRIGYADYLRTAGTTDLLVAVLPGVAGLALLTAAGGAIGVRQARAAQTLPAPQIARFMP